MSEFVSLTGRWQDGLLRRSSLGVAFFWGFAVFIDLWAVRLAQVMTGGGEGFARQSSIFMVVASLGMVAGLGFTSHLLQKRIAFGWMPMAGIGMTVAATALAFVVPSGGWFLIALGALAFFAAVLFAPLGEWLRICYPAANSGELQLSVNLQDFCAVIGAVGFLGIFESGAKAVGILPTAGYRVEIALVGMSSGLLSALIVGRRPGDLARLIGGTVIRWIYRIQVVNPERVPEKGGALLLPNHLTYLDAFFISAAFRQPVRFVMDETFMASRAIRVFVSIFDTVTIRTSQPREAIRITIDALKNGELVCLFPEGQLTRTGTLNELRRGFELIAKKAGHPLIPIWCDGAWGSIFSYEGGRYFNKRPTRAPGNMIIAMGQKMEPEAADLAAVQRGLMTASAEAIGQRFAAAKWETRLPKAQGEPAERFRASTEATRRQLWANGHQIGQISALPWRQPFSILRDDPTPTEVPGLRVTFPELFGAEVQIRELLEGWQKGSWVGGDDLRKVLGVTQLSAEIVFYDFGSRALEPIYRAGVLHCPCLAVASRVIAMSMPHPTAPWSDSEPQIGHKLGTWGKLLPGWFLVPSENGECRAHGPATSPEGLALPKGCVLDAEGFLGPSRVEDRR
jgi:acyl-[acyl-carrier-protein]-phospholipid O-acyltransferase/long-chain-fatty-acid--[acyl-carrier-protein] ligase